MSGEFFYRYEDRLESVGSCDSSGDYIYHSVCRVHLHKLPVQSHTPCGVWLLTLGGQRRFVLTQGRKRYALPTEGEARDSFLARKRAQVRHLSRQIANAEQAIRMIGWEKEPGAEKIEAFEIDWT